MAPKQNTADRTSDDELVLEMAQTEEPHRYTIVLHNDDFTTQEFVVHVLVSFLHKNAEDAYRLMLKVHLEGKAKIGSYTKDIAETKVAMIVSFSRQNGMPLLATSERV